MRSRTSSPGRLLPDGTPLQNRLLAALPALEYDRIAPPLRIEWRFSALRSTIIAAASTRLLPQRRRGCCRHDRVDADEFALKQEFLAIMLGVRRATVTVVLGGLQDAGLISSRYGRMHVLRRKGLEAASCECYAVIRRHFTRLGL
jgi:CRP-like cAMP-binding protein